MQHRTSLMNKSGKLKHRIQEGMPTVGCFVNLYAPGITECLAQAGFDFIILDTEHGAFSQGELENMIRACDVSALASVVRVDYDPSSVQKALDMGADGILVPMIRTVEDVRSVMRRAKYPPKGNRGADFYSRAYQYRKEDPRGYLTAQNEDTLVILQVETTEAVSNLEQIMSEEGVDAIFIGAMDLSVSMGELSPATSAMQNLLQQIYAKARKAGMPTGATFVDRAGYHSLRSQKVVFLATTVNACLTTGVSAITDLKEM